MNEFVTVSSSSYDPASLATKLTEKSAQGWEIVAIVPTGGDVTAFLSREATGAAADSAAMMTSEDTSAPAAAAMPEAAPAMAEAAPSEPAGWAVAPDPAPTSSAPATVIQTSSPFSSMDTSSASAPNYAAAAPAAPAPAPTPTPAVPAGWYADPAGRFDLRYWDGGTWTEHVSRAGQQFTDAPVA